MKNVFEQINSSISVVDYLRNKGFDVKNLGGGQALHQCPFCEGHDCFRIFSGGRKWSCFQCKDRKIGKDVIDLEYYFGQYSKYNDAIKVLADQIGIDYKQEEFDVIAAEIKQKATEYYHFQLEDDRIYEFLFKDKRYNGTIKQYLTELRKHSEETLNYFQVGVSDGLLTEYLIHQGFQLKEIRLSGLVKEDRDLFRAGLIVFPQYVNGRVSHFTCKDPAGKTKPFQTETRFRASNWRFYNQDCLFQDVEDKIIVLVEGENDLLSVVGKVGYETVLASIGMLKEEQVEFLRNQSKLGWSFVLAFDGDEEGKNYRNIIIERVGGNVFDIPVSEKGIPLGSDIDDLLCESNSPKQLFDNLLLNVDADPRIYKISKRVEGSKVAEKKEDKVPHSIEHERFLLRNLIRGDNLIPILDKIEDKEVFYKILHQEMYEAIKELYEDNRTINMLISYTLFQDKKILKSDEEFDEIMIDSFTSDIESAVDILLKKYRRREILSFAKDVEKTSLDEAKEIENVEDIVSNRFFKIYNKIKSSSSELSTVNLLETSLANKKTYDLIGTPYPDINEHLLVGFNSGDIVVIAGRTGMGKSIFKTNLKPYWCRKKIGVLDFCPENRVRMEQTRLDSLMLQIPYEELYKRVEGDFVDQKCIENHRKIVNENWGLWHFDEIERLNLGFIARKVIQCQKERPDLEHWIVCLDLANKVQEFVPDVRMTTYKIAQGLRKLRTLARDIGFCPINIVQIGRGKEREKKLINKRPAVSDLKDSGSWEEDSDLIFLLFREKYYNSDLDVDIIEINIAKQRSFSSNIIVPKIFNKETTTIGDEEIGTSYFAEELPPLD
jgi:replicative DNA helicase